MIHDENLPGFLLFLLFSSHLADIWEVIFIVDDLNDKVVKYTL